MERLRDFVSNGKTDLQAVDLSTVIKKITTLCKERAATQGIEVGVEGIRRPLPSVRADRLQIEQVLNNLITNAIEAAILRPGGRGRVMVRVGARGNKVVIQVEDNGPGVAPEIAGRMFDLIRQQSREEWGLDCILVNKSYAVMGEIFGGSQTFRTARGLWLSCH